MTLYIFVPYNYDYSTKMYKVQICGAVSGAGSFQREIPISWKPNTRLYGMPVRMKRRSEDAQSNHRQSRLGLRERKKRETAERIYRTALNLFRERGYDGTTVEDIAQAADVAKGTFFNYFPTKDAVLSYLGQQQMQFLYEAIAAKEDFDQQSAYEQLTFVFDSLAAGIQDNHEIMRTVSLEIYRSESAFADMLSSSRQLYELLLSIVRRRQERGELRTTALAESMALILLATYVYTVIAWRELDSPPALALMLHAHLDLLLQGMQST